MHVRVRIPLLNFPLLTGNCFAAIYDNSILNNLLLTDEKRDHTMLSTVLLSLLSLLSASAIAFESSLRAFVPSHIISAIAKIN